MSKTENNAQTKASELTHLLGADSTPKRELLGCGVLSWPKTERVSDRYGFVNLYPDERTENAIQLKQVIGKGKLIVLVIETRESQHIGDFFRGLFSQTPKINDEIELGCGEICYGDYNSVGLSPDDGRESDWLDPKQLYRAHGQTVELYFEPSA